MTDDYWIHGDSTVTAILKTARSAVPGKGMPPWKDVIPEETLEAVAVYISALTGPGPINLWPNRP